MDVIKRMQVSDSESDEYDVAKTKSNKRQKTEEDPDVPDAS
jgi:hypothetical protein